MLLHVFVLHRSAGTTPTTGTPSGTQPFQGPPAFGPVGVFDPSGNSASSLFISIALTLGFSVIAFL